MSFACSQGRSSRSSSSRSRSHVSVMLDPLRRRLDPDRCSHCFGLGDRVCGRRLPRRRRPRLQQVVRRGVLRLRRPKLWESLGGRNGLHLAARPRICSPRARCLGRRLRCSGRLKLGSRRHGGRSSRGSHRVRSHLGRSSPERRVAVLADTKHCKPAYVIDGPAKLSVVCSGPHPPSPSVPRMPNLRNLRGGRENMASNQTSRPKHNQTGSCSLRPTRAYVTLKATPETPKPERSDRSEENHRPARRNAPSWCNTFPDRNGSRGKDFGLAHRPGELPTQT